jgi:hypothetical protein
MKFKKQSRSYDDPLRGWLIEVMNKDGSQAVFVVNPLGYESILKNSNVENVKILAFGVFDEVSLDSIILKYP